MAWRGNLTRPHYHASSRASSERKCERRGNGPTGAGTLEELGTSVGHVCGGGGSGLLPHRVAEQDSDRWAVVLLRQRLARPGGLLRDRLLRNPAPHLPGRPDEGHAL